METATTQPRVMRGMPLVMDADEQLLERFRRGESAAFEDLFVRHYPQVHRVLHRLTHSPEEADDLAQETFLALYHHPPALRGDTPSLAAWLYRVALNHGYNALRSARRADRRLERVAAPPTSVDPQDEAVRAEERAGVRAALAALPERQAKLLTLRHAGFAYAEIAAILEVAPGSVGTLLIRAERAFLEAYRRAGNAEHTGLMHSSLE